MKQITIFGASGFGGEDMRKLSSNGLPVARRKLMFVDDSLPASECNGRRVFSYSEWLAKPASSRHINIAIANSDARENLVQRCRSDEVQFFEVRAASELPPYDV
jgi:hypothetical protein